MKFYNPVRDAYEARFNAVSSTMLRRIMRHSPVKGDRMMAYGILVNRKGKR